MPRFKFNPKIFTSDFTHLLLQCSQHVSSLYSLVLYTPFPESLRGARVVVTGASTGIGEQIAYHYARFGAQIVITARREKVLQQVSRRHSQRL